MDEFSFIAGLLAPLAQKEPGALGLTDDAAVLHVPAGQELVVTKDAMSEGVHFIGDEAPRLIARKLLRVNLSDLAAMGAEPWGYFLALMLPEGTGEAWLTGFAEGLRLDQHEYGITLMGGDTTRIQGTLSLSLTALGLVPEGQALTRAGAKPGDAIYLSGTLGDAALGLAEARAKRHPEAYLLQRYRLPEPRLKLGCALRGIASACMDVSDGLLQDMGHIAASSGVGAEIRCDDLPLSPPARRALAMVQNPHETIAAGGDDYELLFTVPEENEARLAYAAQAANTPVTRIGSINPGRGVRLLSGDGSQIPVKSKGYRHF